MKRADAFTSIRTEGGLLPADLLVRVAAFDKDLAGITPTGYHLADGERINDAINRSWNRLVGAWAGFSESLARIPADDRTATNITRSRWSLVLFQELGYGQLQTTKAAVIDGKTYAVSHGWGQVPVHLVGARVPLDRRTEGVAGAATMSPHGLVQEYLNRSDDHLWGFVSNGMLLRLLRDNATLTRQAFVEFDLEAIFAGNEYPAFAILWLLCHQSRLEGEPASSCLLELWSAEAAKQGTRALDQLRGGVEIAIAALGTGFLAHRDNSVLREALRSGELDKQDYYRQLLRLVYRLLFLFVAEDRGLLLDPDASATAKERYDNFYSLGRVRELASRRRGGPHGDLWAQLQVVFSALGRAEGAPSLALPGLGSFLWSDGATPALDAAQLPNRQLLAAVLALTSVNEGKVRRSVDYRNLGSEELGSIYESLLELHPALSVEARTFALSTAAGNERKTTGSYYTPTGLINELLDTALDPVLVKAASQSDPETAILDLKVLDPACGSGHFLIAAAHRIAKRLAAVRFGDDEPAPDVTRAALRDVIGRCLHGIDLNPMAVELCKVSLWMEAMQPGKPLGFLDHRIIQGNALLGATPGLLVAGVPDDAFKVLTGDDKSFVSSLRKRNKEARSGQTSLFTGEGGTVISKLAARAEQVDAIADDTITSVQAKAARWSELVLSADYQVAIHTADTWCAAFVAPKHRGAPVITQVEFELARDAPEKVDPATRVAVAEMTAKYGFLHWHLAFLDVYTGGRHPGFDVVLGNPPWEQVQYDPREVFASTHHEISAAANMAKRNRLVAALSQSDPPAFEKHLEALRTNEGYQHFLHNSGRYPLTSFGRLNTAPLFAELARQQMSTRGRVGLVLPTGIATDSFNQRFFRSLVDAGQLVSLFAFENEDFIFVGVHHSFKFCLLTLARSHDGEGEYVFFARKVDELYDSNRKFVLSSEDFKLINPNTGTAPIFRGRRDAELARQIYRRVPVLVQESSNVLVSPWGIDFQLMFMMNTGSKVFLTSEDLQELGATRSGHEWRTETDRWIPLYEGKMIHLFDHRYGTYDGQTVAQANQGTLPTPSALDHLDPSFVPTANYWISESEVSAASRAENGWMLGFRDITNSISERTLVPSILPLVATGDTIQLANPSSVHGPLLGAILSTFIADYCSRQKVGGTHLRAFTAKQLPVVPPEMLDQRAPWCDLSIAKWLSPRVLELTFTAWDLEAFGRQLKYMGPPFRWDSGRREGIRCEIDAALFHLYGLVREDVDYIMDTFSVLRRKEEARDGEFRSKRLVLERYDALAECIARGTEYQTMLDPPPAHPSLAHHESTRPEWA